MVLQIILKFSGPVFHFFFFSAETPHFTGIAALLFSNNYVQLSINRIGRGAKNCLWRIFLPMLLKNIQYGGAFIRPCARFQQMLKRVACKEHGKGIVHPVGCRRQMPRNQVCPDHAVVMNKVSLACNQVVIVPHKVVR